MADHQVSTGGLVNGLLALLGPVKDPSNITKDEQAKAKEKVAEAVKVVLLISEVDKQRYGRLKEHYLLTVSQRTSTAFLGVKKT